MDASPPPPLAPLHVLPVLDTPPPQRKPAIITFLGIIAITIAGLSMLASGVAAMIALGLMIRTQVSNTMATSTARTRSTVTWKSTSHGTQPPVIPSDSAYPTGPRGLNETQRASVRVVLNKALKLSDVQEKRLDQLLAKSGKDIFEFGVPSGAGPNVVSESGTLGTGAGTGNYYLVGSGKIELYADRGVFFPTNGEPVRVWEDEKGDDDSTSNAISAKRIDELIADIQIQTQGKFTAAQQAAFKQELSDPNQALIMRDSPGQRFNATLHPDGSVAMFAKGFIQIDAAGKVTSSTSSVMGAFTNFKVRSAATVMTLLDALLGGLLAIYLLVVGILVLRQHRKARGMQTIFAILKLPLAVLGAIGWMWTIADANAGAIPGGQLKFWLVTFLVIGLAYPIALLIALRTGSVREYYHEQVR